MTRITEIIMFDQDDYDLIYNALQALKHRDLCIMTDYGTKAINGRRASEQLDNIDRMMRSIYPYTRRSKEYDRAFIN